MSASLSGCVKTHTSAKCGKYNSPTRYRAICAQHDLALMMRNFSNMFLRARRALEFSHGLDPNRTLVGADDRVTWLIQPDLDRDIVCLDLRSESNAYCTSSLCGRERAA